MPKISRTKKRLKSSKWIKKRNTEPHGLSDPDIRFKLTGVCKCFPGRQPVPSLQNITINIHEHCITGLVGPTGCGKSTLAKILMGLEKQDSGSLLYQGTPLEKVPVKEFRRKNQLVFQSAVQAINPRFTVRRALAEPLLINRLPKPLIAEKLSRTMDLLNLPQSYLDRFPARLSGGEAQRVGLGRALIQEPEFIVLDEPIANLDQENAMRLMLFLKSLHHDLKTGFLFISHFPEQTEFLCDRVIRMDHH